MPSLRRAVLRLLLPSLLLLGVPVCLQEGAYWLRYRMDIVPFRSATRAYLQTYLDDQKILAEEPFFTEGTRKRNAARVLNPMLEGLQTTDQAPHREVTRESDSHRLTDSLRQRLKEWGPNFARYHSTLDYGATDLNWMAELGEYDYWDVLEELSPEDSFENGAAVALYLAQTLVPSFEDLTLLGKMRLMKGLYDGQLDLAVRETRQLARLLYSTETLMGAMSAIAILRAELGVADYLQEAVQTHFIDWKPMKREWLDRARRAILASNALFSVFSLEEDLTAVFGVPEFRIGLCSGLAKGLLRALLTRPLLEPRVWGERDFAPIYGALDEAVAEPNGRCRLKQLKTVWERRESSLVWVGLFGSASWDRVNFHWVRYFPYARRAWGIDLAAAFASNGLTAYEKSLP